MLFENVKEEIKYLMKKVLLNYNLNDNEVDFEVSEPPI
jgi:hypothetical protein